MESVKKWLAERNAKKNGLFVHYSPPKLVGIVSAAQLRQWARGGAANKLERAVLAGQGRRLLAEAEALPLSRHLPALVAKCQALHTAVERGSLQELQELLDSDYNRRKNVMCRDEAGVGLLHKAVYYDFMDIVEYLVKHYPQLVQQKDSEGRTALHYTAMCREEAAAAALLERAGAARGARDAAGRTPAHYRGPGRTSLALPAASDMPPEPIKNQASTFKRHNIRIWCHDCDMAKLQRVVWEGHGAKLLMEVSKQPVVKRFLEAVPYIMNTIREIHNAVVQNDLEALMKYSSDPVPPQILSSRDNHNMTVLHKAAGLGYSGIVKYIANRYPEGIKDVDNDGRTPLHYAAVVKDDQHTYNTLVSYGADEGAVDKKNRTPGYYINRPQEIDKNIFKTLPEAPRTASSAYPPTWDWKLLDTEVISELNKKSRKKTFKASSDNNSSKSNTNTVSDSVANHAGPIRPSNTHEFIKDLPELDDKSYSKNNNANVAINKDSEVVDNKDMLKENEDLVENKNEEFVENKSEELAENKSEELIENEDQQITKPDEDNIENIGIASINENSTDDDTKNDPANEAELNKETGESEFTHNEHDTGESELIPDDNNLIENDSPDKNKAQESSNLDSNESIKENAEIELQETVQNRNTENDVESKNIEDQNILNNDTQDDDSDTIQNHSVVNEINEQNQEINIETSNNENQINTNDTNNAKNKELIVKDNEEPTIEGNSNSIHNEDDDDVLVQGDSQSDYSDINLKSTAEATDTNTVKRGSLANGSNTQESLIEGIVRGEAEYDSQDSSVIEKEGLPKGEILTVDHEIDPEVSELINTANMEMLAALVLNGEGSRLVGRGSVNPELKAFLDNVPTYMQKINKVHLAAREGNIRELQAALDRRKFAIARDPISPNGATPLHLATIFGKTNIVKYLGGRFPETLSAVDYEGRTALHYAAVLPDNGHYYNLLQQLGANSKDLDDNGRSAEEYFKDPNLLPFKQLLADFDISEAAAKEMLSDKDVKSFNDPLWWSQGNWPIFTGKSEVSQPTNGHMDIPIFRTEEGKYLAKSLGDPLIKGLTEVANAKPKDPVAFLASFLQNFPDHEKPRLGTQETNLMVTQEPEEMENEQAAPGEVETELLEKPMVVESRNAALVAARPHLPIDVVTVDPQPAASPDVPEPAFSSTNRDEHGQSMLHFAAARTHTRNAIFQLLQESDISLAYRDELYRTARDVSIQANVPDNTVEIDRWVLQLAARGNTEKIMELLLEGYDHLLDVVDDEGVLITEVVSQRGVDDMSNLLASIPAFEESRETLHNAVRRGDLSAVQETISAEGGRTLARAKNSFGRTALHVAVLAQHEEVVAQLAQNCPELLRIGDNLERTPLHYAMGVEKMESLSRILIRAGAKRVLKDLKGRQPSYYFMNKSDILRLKEEEQIH